MKGLRVHFSVRSLSVLNYPGSMQCLFQSWGLLIDCSLQTSTSNSSSYFSNIVPWAPRLAQTFTIRMSNIILHFLNGRPATSEDVHVCLMILQLIHGWHLNTFPMISHLPNPFLDQINQEWLNLKMLLHSYSSSKQGEGYVLWWVFWVILAGMCLDVIRAFYQILDPKSYLQKLVRPPWEKGVCAKKLQLLQLFVN